MSSSLHSVSPHFWSECRRLLARDPGGRGLTGAGPENTLLAAAGLEPAARNLAAEATSVAIVTGFYVEGPAGPTIETDGPPGALLLARVLRALGINVTLVTDPLGMPVLEAGLRHLDLPHDMLHALPYEPCASHLVAIERAGPSHTVDSLRGQHATSEQLAEFERDVPAEHRDRCHNLRGIDITPSTAAAHALFEQAAAQKPRITTIGIGDGGNEIGMGCVPWDVLRRAISIGPAARVACRIATDHLIVAGTSDWGAYALAAGVCVLRGRRDVLEPCTAAAQEQLIQCLVRDGGAVDGITRLAAPTVDGLPLATYLQTLVGIRRLCEFDS
ncbi:MAG TPA: glutamate cyclase domain-containing protein [Pirellulales bacterium]|jgi:hypothetical protein|nr:glutamate cyclase domain-containing protein [Pirellulales bacterium]